VQMLGVAGVRYFQDVLSLEPGDRWERKLNLGIDECDLFLLFWSSAAKRSEWVRKEVAYALARSRGDELLPPEIKPVILEGPPIVELWEELAQPPFQRPARVLHARVQRRVRAPMRISVQPSVRANARPPLGTRDPRDLGASRGCLRRLLAGSFNERLGDRRRLGESLQAPLAACRD
jgi:TIR domain